MAHLKFWQKVLFTAIVMAGSGPAFSQDNPQPTLTGHIDLTSRYYLRGLTSTYGNSAPLGNRWADAPESDKPALQWGVDYVHPSGWFAGYWGSQINYSYKQLGNSYRDRSITDFQKQKSFENDFYGGYNGTVGSVGYTVGATAITYLPSTASNALESKLGLSYGPVSVAAQTIVNDVVWGNRGDTYWTVVYATSLPHSMAFNANLGFYTYKKEGKYLGTKDTLTGTTCAGNEAFVVNGCYAGNRPAASGFRHLILSITQPIGNTGFTWGLQGILGGKNRFDVNQANRIAASLSYGF